MTNTWGVANLPGSPFWISNQGTGTSSLFTATGNTGVAPANFFPPPATNFVAIPPGPGAGVGPTGIVANSGTSFGIAGGPALFIFANLNGTISAWNLSNVNSATKNAATVVATTPGALTGLAINSTGTLLYAANGTTGAIDVFNSSFTQVSLPGAFATPPAISAKGLVPFNVDDIGGDVYVTYAPSGRTAQAQAALGQGAVAVFNESGVLQKTLVGSASVPLAAPWGVALAPTTFGKFGGDLLVGNFSFFNSEINAFNPVTDAFEGSISINDGTHNAPGGLWSLVFGSGGSGSPNTLYFTDGINNENAGLFGAITSVPEPSTWAMMLVGLGGLGLLAERRRRQSLAIGSASQST